MKSSLLISLCLGFCALVMSGCQTDAAETSHEVKREVLARVNGEPIYESEFKRELSAVRVDDPEGAPIGLADMVQLRNLLKDQIDRRLLLQAASDKKVVVSAAQIEAAYRRMRMGWESEAFQTILKGRSISVAGLKRELRESLTVQQYLLDYIYARLAITDQQITAYLEEHPKRLVQAPSVRALQVVVASREKAKEIAREIRRGLSFEDAAMQHSLSPEGKSGGDLGFFAKGTMPLVFERAFAMWPGQVSEILESDYGFHLLKLLEKREEQELPLMKVRDEVEDELLRSAQREAMRKTVEQLREAATLEMPSEEDLEKFMRP
jgi:peptidyl-prolyl cis-trans isomerase C